MKFVCMLSGGIDSPVAAYLMKQKGHEVICLNFKTRREKKVKQLAKLIGCKLKTKRHAWTLRKIQKRCEERLTCVLCKRAMLTYAAKLAKKIGADAILTGDNIGQVASQTLDNMAAEQRYVDIPIVRPLIGLNKEEIIDIAKEIGTYEISITDSLACSFAPKRPATHSVLEDVDIEWAKLGIKN